MTTADPEVAELLHAPPSIFGRCPHLPLIWQVAERRRQRARALLEARLASTKAQRDEMIRAAEGEAT